ncbi:MAG: XrtA system polysaccharide chain length determinant [Pontixanthobacter sp.]
MNEVFEDLRAAVFSVWQRRWLALGVAWAVCVLGWLAVALIPNAYESEARIYVQLDDILAEQLKIAGGTEREIKRIRSTLVSSVNLEKVIRSTRLGDGVQSQKDLETAIADLTEALTIESEEDNLFEIKAEIGKGDLSDADNAKLAQNVVQKLIDIFRNANLAGNRGDVAETIIFLDQQLDERKLELEAAEQRRLAFESANPDLIGGTATLSGKRQLLRSDLRDVEADLAAAQSALAAIDGQLSTTPRTIAGFATNNGGGTRQALAEVRGQLSAMQARGLTVSHPDIKALNKQIELLARQASRDTPGNTGLPNPAYSSLVSIKAERQANVQSLASRQAALQSELAALMASQSNEPAVAAEATRISRDYEVLKDNYDELLQNREEMKLRGQVENERSSFKFEVIDPPTAPQSPSAPNRPLMLIGVLLAGLAAGVGVAFAVGHLRSTFATTAKLERALDLPVLGAISHITTDAARVIRDKRLRYLTAGTASLGGLCLILLAVEFFQRGTVA